MKNPMTGEPLSHKAADHVTDLRTVRRNAKKAARSGNPAKRGPARDILAGVPLVLRETYLNDAALQGQVLL